MEVGDDCTTPFGGFPKMHLARLDSGARDRVIYYI
jgi:hypothetical protein